MVGQNGGKKWRGKYGGEKMAGGDLAGENGGGEMAGKFRACALAPALVYTYTTTSVDLHYYISIASCPIALKFDAGVRHQKEKLSMTR